MKLSEAITLGSTIVKPKPGLQFDLDTNAGCAFGMAVIAAGGGYTVRTKPLPDDLSKLRTEGMGEVSWWPWTSEIAKRPCNCRLFLPNREPRIFFSKKMAIKDIIVHIFDRHVFVRRDWTLDQLIAWVASVEPKEDLTPRPISLEQWSIAAINTTLRESKDHWLTGKP